MSNEIIRLPNDIEIEAIYDFNREFVEVKIRRLKDGDIRNGKSGLKFRAYLGSFFDIAEGQEYPQVCSYAGPKEPKREPDGHARGCLCTVCKGARGEL